MLSPDTVREVLHEVPLQNRMSFRPPEVGRPDVPEDTFYVVHVSLTCVPPGVSRVLLRDRELVFTQEQEWAYEVHVDVPRGLLTTRDHEPSVDLVWDTDTLPRFPRREIKTESDSEGDDDSLYITSLFVTWSVPGLDPTPFSKTMKLPVLKPLESLGTGPGEVRVYGSSQFFTKMVCQLVREALPKIIIPESCQSLIDDPSVESTNVYFKCEEESSIFASVHWKNKSQRRPHSEVLANLMQATKDPDMLGGYSRPSLYIVVEDIANSSHKIWNRCMWFNLST
jgi:hypothetical protein